MKFIYVPLFFFWLFLCSLVFWSVFDSNVWVTMTEVFVGLTVTTLPVVFFDLKR